jgi:ribosome biogenesis GTPase
MKHYEESDFFHDRKAGRQNRKIASRLDRSQYKKTDQDKLKLVVDAPQENLRKGIVVTVRSQEIVVDSNGEIITCTLRGILKKNKTLLKNLVIVGDVVFFDSHNGIISVEVRKSVLSRADNLSQQKEHLIAANVDQVLIFVAVVDPMLRPSIIDRYLIAAAKGNLTPVIICNKMDLLVDPNYGVEERAREAEKLEECKKIYSSIGVPFIPICCKDGTGVDEVIKIMKDRTSVFSGQSGTGKSSFINEVCHLQLRVGKTVASSRKGAHTTSLAELIQLPFGGYVVDTPGIKSFGIWNLSKDEVRSFFPEIVEAAHQCKFQDCSHREEIGCAIPDAIEAGKVTQLRYDSYLNLLASVEAEHLRR